MKEKKMTEDEKSLLELEYESALPAIVGLSGVDLVGALVALDRFLDREPPPRLRRALLSWKGRFYIEHERYEDAVRVLRPADELPTESELGNYNTKADLATALKGIENWDGAYDVLTTGLDEIEDNLLLLSLLRALVEVAAKTGQAMPSTTRTILLRVASFYGMDALSEEEDAASLTVWLSDLAHTCGVKLNRLTSALRRAETDAEKERLVAGFLEEVDVPYFRERAKAKLAK